MMLSLRLSLRVYCPFALSLRVVPSLGLSLRVVPSLKVLSRAMDCTEFRKDGSLLARLYGKSQLGTFTAFTKMVVTDAGVLRGYSSLQYSQLVNTPWARQLQHKRVQQPMRTGMLYRILLGTTATGRKKAADRQQRLLCLSLVEKKSTWGDGIIDPRGTEQNQGQNWNMEQADYYAELYCGDKPLSMNEVFTTPQTTRGYRFHEIYTHETDGTFPDAAEHPWNGGSGEGLRKYFVEEKDSGCYTTRGGLRELAETQIVKFALPSVTTAYGQAKRSRVQIAAEPKRASTRSKPQKRSRPSDSDSDSES